jgi:glutathione synthase/RimK-type ligase-like ATP-grasp enzyme
MGMNLYFMLAFSRSKEPNPVLVELFERLRARGYHVEIGVGSELLLEHAQLAREHDLYILKSHTALWLSLAGIVHRQGGRLLNPYLPCLAVYNKIVATYRMRSAGIPTPPSWVVGDLRMLRPIVARSSRSGPSSSSRIPAARDSASRS